MTPKEKAGELYSKYDDLLNKDFGNPIVFDNQLKQCALIAVDEILNSTPARSPISDSSDFMSHFKAIKYWQEVKQEIENL